MKSRPRKTRPGKTRPELSRPPADSELFLATLMADVRDGSLHVATQKIDARRDIIDAHPFASYLAGLIRVAKGEEERAIAHFGRAIALSPEHAQALYGRAVALQKCGRARDALADYEASLRLDPANVEGWFNYGEALIALQRHSDACDAWTRVLALAPGHAAALGNRALALHALGRDAEAIADYDRAIALAGADKALLRNRAVSLARLARHEEALASFAQAFALDAAYLDAADGAAAALMALRRFDEAGALCDHVLSFAPDHGSALLTKGNALHELKRFEEALAVFDAALARAADDVRLATNRGMALFELGRFDEAHAAALAAIAIDASFALAWRCRGMTELRRAELDQALVSFDRALRLESADADVLCGRAIVLKELGRYDEALADFDRAIAIDPRHAEAKANKGSLLLLLGEFAEGWELFEHRWVQGDRPKAEIAYRWPEWRGEPLAGKSIVVLDEAGLGDALQFSRYAPLLAAAGARAAYHCRPSLARVMRGLGLNVEIVTAPPPDANYDCCVTICSLPRAFATRADTISGRPYLRAEPERVAHWRERLGDGGFKVGIAWHGSSHSRSDHTRAAPLSAFAPLSRIDGVRLVSLQKNFGAEQLRSAPAGMRVESLGADFDCGADAFVDTAAVIANLDLVVTIDTSIAHLAGALGQKVWIAIKHSPEWRWMLEREDTPWYDSARLFRQERRGDWDDVFSRMARELERAVHAARPAPAARSTR
ncbi:tetratricopeptide repeat protein [Methylosinus sp. Sm6]|uniref:tetratricopeptide repeat-containing glycosyltransferase family protein n=1 Tax=Methylosinus sp. Sm6 TaxID=2866948 RepID=UPI0021083C4D|nr:tetratricopeptide repeat protein [Methylosinus sp. Sm6]